MNHHRDLGDTALQISDHHSADIASATGKVLEIS